MALKRIEQQYEQVGCLERVIIGGQVGQLTLTLAFENGPDMVFTLDQAKELKSVIEDLIKWSAEKPVNSVSAGELTKALLMGSLSVGQNGEAVVENNGVYCHEDGYDPGTWKNVQVQCGRCTKEYCRCSAVVSTMQMKPSEVYMVLDNKKIPAIKAIRERTGCNLALAKDLVEQTSFRLCDTYYTLPGTTTSDGWYRPAV